MRLVQPRRLFGRSKDFRYRAKPADALNNFAPLGWNGALASSAGLCVSKTRIVPRPARLAIYMARSAASVRSSARLPLSGPVAMPILALIETSRPAISKGCCSPARTRFAMNIGFASSRCELGSSIANSSPPSLRNEPVLGRTLMQALSDSNEQRIARRVPQRVIDWLEAIEVDKEHRALVPAVPNFS